MLILIHANHANNVNKFSNNYEYLYPFFFFQKYSDFKFCAVVLVDPAGPECFLSQTELKAASITTKQRITGSSLNKEAIHKIMFWMESVCISADMKSIRYLWLTADVMQYFHSVTL